MASRYSDFRLLESWFINQITHSNIDRLGYSHEGENAGRSFTALQLANVNRVQISLFCQLLLAHFCMFVGGREGLNQRCG
jgi:hypothetical protein